MDLPQKIVIDPKNKHQNTLIWIHGLTETAEQHKKFFESPLFQSVKVILPQAPKSFVTVGNAEYTSWYDIKFRSEKSFIVPFDEAFSSDQVHKNYQNILKPLIIQARKQLDEINPKGQLIVGGFSQGCGMSLHCFYEEPQLINSVIGMSGYLFPFTKFNKADKRKKKILYGLNDQLRPWDYVKICFEGKLSVEKGQIMMISETGHEVNLKMVQQMQDFVKQAISSKQ